MHSDRIVAMYSGARLPPSFRSEATLVLMTKNIINRFFVKNTPELRNQHHLLSFFAGTLTNCDKVKAGENLNALLGQSPRPAISTPVCFRAGATVSQAAAS
jgi:hypothetical protein